MNGRGSVASSWRNIPASPAQIFGRWVILNLMRASGYEKKDFCARFSKNNYQNFVV
jgi:hypothetical protein